MVEVEIICCKYIDAFVKEIKAYYNDYRVIDLKMISSDDFYMAMIIYEEK